MKYEISNVLVLSTAHLTEKDSNYLDKMAEAKGIFDYLVYVSSNSEEEDIETYDNRHTLIELAKFARKLNCSYLLFNSDGPIYEEFPTFDW